MTSPGTGIEPLGGLHVEIPPRLKSFLTHPFSPRSLKTDVEASASSGGGFGEMRFDFKAMKEFAGDEVAERFRTCLLDGNETSPEDAKALEAAVFSWCSAHSCMNYAHWFFPLRTGGGAMGGTAGMKHDSFIDADWDAQDPFHKTFKATMPPGRLFTGETDGSSFPTGGLRTTSRAAAFTSWDRASPPFIYQGTCYIPCALVSHLGLALDDKTPLLRSQDSLNRQGLRLLKNIGGYADVQHVVSYLGWEQEFFVISKAAYLARPDLRACGRTLIGAPPACGQEMDMNYFAAMPPVIKACMNEVHEELLKIGCPLNVHHNEVAPAQYEISPFFTIASLSADMNEIAMQVCCDVAAKHDLVFLFHEKPFAGMNGSGKHNNWSVGTDTNLNFFCPGLTEKSSELFAAATACLAYALNQHNTVLRGAVAHAGNDHRLGAQEAPPAILSLDPGPVLEEKMRAIIDGGALAGFEATTETLPRPAANLNPIRKPVTDRNRTAPFPFCGNRWEFRAVGSSQNCAFPMAMLNTCFADGMRALSDLLEGNCGMAAGRTQTNGPSHSSEGRRGGVGLRDACALMFEENQRVVFTGDTYSAAWRDEAKRRGLPNLSNSVEAAAAFGSAQNKALLARMGVLSEAEVDARVACLFENYTSVVAIEAATLVGMVRQGVEAAMAQDLNVYGAHPRAHARRASVYNAVSEQATVLEELLQKGPPPPPAAAASSASACGAVEASTGSSGRSSAGGRAKREHADHHFKTRAEAAAEAESLHAKTVAEFYVKKVVPCLAKLRQACDAAEGLVQIDLWPFPSYTDICFGHLTEAPRDIKKSRV